MNLIHDEYRKNKRLTPEYLKSRIAAVEFETKETFGQKAVFCHLQLDNGFIIYGEKPSMAIDPVNFDMDKGQQIAYQNTFNQLWPLFAFSKLEQAREESQSASLVDWRDFLDVVDQKSWKEPETMRNLFGATFQFKESGYRFQHNFAQGEDVAPYLVQKIYEHLGAETVEPKRIAFIAKICHEANRAYCSSIGDDSQPSWADAPGWQKDSAIAGVKFHLSGEHDPSESHQSWYDQKKADGWVYGPVKDAEKKEHPCMVAYDQLPVEQRSKDYIFRSIVHSFK